MSKIILKNGGYIEITEEQKKRWQRIYKHIDINLEIANLEYCYNNDFYKKQTSKGILKDINKQLKKLNELYKKEHGGIEKHCVY